MVRAFGTLHGKDRLGSWWNEDHPFPIFAPPYHLSDVVGRAAGSCLEFLFHVALDFTEPLVIQKHLSG